MCTLLPIVKKVISNQINQIKSRIMHKTQPNKIKNTSKRVSNREIKLFDVKKSKYLDDDDVEYKGIKNLEHLF